MKMAKGLDSQNGCDLQTSLLASSIEIPHSNEVFTEYLCLDSLKMVIPEAQMTICLQMRS